MRQSEAQMGEAATSLARQVDNEFIITHHYCIPDLTRLLYKLWTLTYTYTVTQR